MRDTARNVRSAALAVVAGMALASAVAFPTAGQPARAAGWSHPALAWGRCPAGVAAPVRTAAGRVVTLECAALRIPLDYRRPAGPTITVAVSRLRAAAPAARRGVLLLNPRGVGRSAPVSCGLSFEQAVQTTAPWPLPGGVAENAALARTVARQCAARSGALLPFITTVNTARDMDRIRAALGVRRISYYGVSYGTYLGAVYASLFPQRTDRVVLDSITDPKGVWRESGFRVAGPGVELRFPDFARFAADRNATYHLGATAAQVRTKYFALAARLDRTPLLTPSGVLTGNLFRSVTLLAMSADSAFAPTARFWQAVRVGDTRTVATLGDEFGLWDSAGFDATTENSVAADLAVICDDAAWPRSVSRYAHDVRSDARRYPIAGALAADIWPCAFWPTMPLEAPLQPNREGLRNLLLVNNLRDPATPYFGAVATRREFGQRARLVGVDQGGHGVYLTNPNPCGNDTVTAYLVNGTMPPRDTLCPATPGPR